MNKQNIGAHLSIAGGLEETLKISDQIGANSMQIFTKSPRGAIRKIITKEDAKTFQNSKLRKKVKHVFIHSSYLLNFAKNLNKTSYEFGSLIDDLKSADNIGATGVVVHIGKTLGQKPDEALNLFIKNIISIIEITKGIKAKIILENTAGQGTEMGYRLEDFGFIVKNIAKKVDEKRIGVCIDTQHAFASGYDLSNKLGVETFFSDFKKNVGIKFLTCIHLNDSKRKCGARVDRHADIGAGEFGKNGPKEFVNFLNKIKPETPKILETPEDTTPFKEQILTVANWT